MRVIDKLPKSRVLGKLRGGRLISELISLSVVSECTFYAVLDSFSTRGAWKKLSGENI